MRIIFAGTPEFACKSLAELVKNKFDIVAVYTQPDRAKGRNKKLTESPVKVMAKKFNIPLEQPENFKQTETITKFAEYKPDIFIVVAYGIILPETLLAVCKKNINVHASLLPKFRGAAPIQYAIMNGEIITGISIMEIVKKLDAGPVINQASLAINNMNANELTDELSTLGAKILIDSLNELDKLWPTRIQQIDNYASHAPKITKEDGLINWHSTAITINNKIRALSNWPNAHHTKNSLNIKIIEARLTDIKSQKSPGTCIIENKQIFITTNDFNLELIAMQLPNKNIMNAQQIICGYKELLLSTFL